MKTEIFTFKVIVTKDIDDNVYLAHCLELDLVTSSSDIDKVVLEMSDIIAVHLQYCLENDNLTYMFRPAPISEWELFFNCKDKQTDVYRKQPFEIDNIIFTPEIRLEKCFVE